MYFLHIKSIFDMVGGRKPKPKHLSLVEGNPGKRPLPDKKVKLSGKIRMPAGFSPKERKIWKAMIDVIPTGMIKEVDVIALKLYCEAVAEYNLARENLKIGYITMNEKSGLLKPSPWFKIKNDAWLQIHKLSAEFGLTPSARARLGIMDAPDDEDDDDIF